MMTSLATEYYQFILAQSIVSAAGAACIFYPSVNAISTWFYHRRAFAIGIVTSGSSVGGVIMPIMVERLIPRVGFGWAMRSCAFLILALCVVANLTIKSRIAPRKKPFRVRDFVAPLKEPTFALTTAAAMTFCFGLFLPFTFIILSARRFGMSARLAGYLVPILNAGR
jgi:MFS family permease